MLLCKRIKIEVSRQDAQALEIMQAKCRGLYNWWVMRLRNRERWNLEQAKKSLQESNLSGRLYGQRAKHVRACMKACLEGAGDGTST